jgi:hypothetical protein
MKTLPWITAATLALGSALVQAEEWQAVSAGPESGETVYIDRDSVHADGAFRKAWVLRNYSAVKTLGDNAFPHMSKRILYAFRCDAGEAGYSQWSFHSGELASGRTVWADNAGHITLVDAASDPALNRVLTRVCQS